MSGGGSDGRAAGHGHVSGEHPIFEKDALPSIDEGASARADARGVIEGAVEALVADAGGGAALGGQVQPVLGDAAEGVIDALGERVAEVPAQTAARPAVQLGLNRVVAAVSVGSLVGVTGRAGEARSANRRAAGRV